MLTVTTNETGIYYAMITKLEFQYTVLSDPWNQVKHWSKASRQVAPVSLGLSTSTTATAGITVLYRVIEVFHNYYNTINWPIQFQIITRISN